MKLVHAFSLLTLLLLLQSGASASVYAQCAGMGCDGPIREVYLICCNEPVYNAGEEGVGTDHSKDCRDYVRNRASAETRRSICNQVNSKGIACPAAVAAIACFSSSLFPTDLVLIARRCERGTSR